MSMEFADIPIVPHELAGVDCCGCIIAVVEEKNVELRCNECGAVMGVIQVDILRGLVGLDQAKAECPHCRMLNTFPGFSEMLAYTCHGCGKPVQIQSGESQPKRIEIHDDTCKWYEFADAEPITVLRCNRCGSHPDVYPREVVCPLCRNCSPVRSEDMVQVIEAWNEMVDPGDQASPL